MSQKLKILQITNRLPFPLNDGGNIATYYVTKMLAQKGHEVHLLSLNTKKHYHDPAPLQEIAKVYTVDIDTTVTSMGILKGFFHTIPYNIQRFESIPFREKMIDLVQKEAFDVIQMEGIYLAIYVEAIRANCKSKIILRAHNIEHQIWRRLSQQNSTFLKKWYYGYLSEKIRVFEAENAPKFDGIIPITDTDAQYFEEKAKNIPIQSIPAGIDFSVYKPSKKVSEPNTLCMLGSLEWQPNVEAVYWMVEKVMPLLLAKNPKIQLHIAGKNPPAALMALEAEGVVMHGMVDSAQDFLNAYDILVVPLFSGSGMRLKIIEAMALGKCIVTTSIGVEGIPCTPKKEILLANDVESMASTILEVLNDNTLKIKIEGGARSFVKEHYDWEKLINDFVQFYIKKVSEH